MTFANFKPYEFLDQGNMPTNVLDEFLGMTTEEVRAVREGNLNSFVTVAMNLTGDFNKASVLRAHCAFAGSEMFIVGRRKFDRRGAVGSHHYTSVYQAETVEPVIKHLREEGYTLFAVDNTPEFNPQVIYDVEMPVKAAFFYGEEQKGLSSDVVQACDATVYIPQPSPVPRSINVAQAAAVVMSEYCRRHRPEGSS